MNDRELRVTDQSSGEIYDSVPLQGSPASFPTQAVVAVITSPENLPQVRTDLQGEGFEPHFLAGERGIELIHAAGGSTRDLRVTRAVQGMVGFEAEHTERHLAELEQGNFIVIVESHDDAATDRAAKVLAAHGATFANYYSRWTSRRVLP